MSFIAIDILRNVTVSCQNRGANNEPKTTTFGGVRRGIGSGQQRKRSCRSYAKGYPFLRELFDSVRTSHLDRFLLVELENQAPTLDEKVRQLLSEVGCASFLKVVSKAKGNEISIDDETKTKGLILISRNEIKMLARVTLDLYGTNKDKKLSVASPAKEGRKGNKEKEKDYAGALGFGPDDVKNAYLKESKGLLPGDALDIALFGRFLADVPELTVESAVCVAFTISTHAAGIETDFVSAVDEDLGAFFPGRSIRPLESRGAGFIGDVQHHPPQCQLETAVINTDLWFANAGKLNGKELDLEQKKQCLAAILVSFIRGVSQAKKSSMFSNEEPSMVMVSVSDGMPLTMASAFENPVKANGEGLVAPSIARLKEHWGNVKANSKSLGKLDRLGLRQIVVLGDDGKPNLATDGKPEVKDECCWESSNSKNYNLMRLVDEIVNAAF
jgi:CRISPR system Cascade subunit CasC